MQFLQGSNDYAAMAPLITRMGIGLFFFSCAMCLTFENRAAFNGHFDVIRVLAAYGADLGKVATDGNTPLHYAAQQGFGPICKFLSQRGEYLVFLYIDSTKNKMYLTVCSHHTLYIPFVSETKWDLLLICDQNK